MRAVPAGDFTMGPDPFGHGASTDVRLSDIIWMDETEVTNTEYVEALQWAWDNGLVQADSLHVWDDGLLLLDLGTGESLGGEIQFSVSEGLFSIVARSDTTAAGWGPGSAWPGSYLAAEHPVKMVTWYGAASYCDWRSLREGFTPYYNGDWSVSGAHSPYAAEGYRLLEGYRLPTEAEWEHATRHDDGRLFPWGDAAPIGCEPLSNSTLCVGWTWAAGSEPAGASALGFLDLSGNVLEWCNDLYTASYPAGPLLDPMGPTTGTRRVLRGGDFGTAPITNSSGVTRQNGLPTSARPWIGFRTVRSLN
ncbi:MAG: SUMF1/EgtB/PvdO family nonheme iron enzyme [Calditrichaeota bacterium]|nr:SUMF1/EgtB/PvdO family nonheme iron enzyme [Calditrichota bacterium]